MKAVLGFFKSKLVIQTIGVTALCVLIWYASPKVMFGTYAPFEPPLHRLIAILIVTVAWALYNLVMQSLANKKEQQLMMDLAGVPPKDSAQAAIEAEQEKEIGDLRRKFEQSLALLSRTRSRGWYDKKYIYDLPWYIIIGAPGCGKTTLLANSGLHFPIAGKTGKHDVQGVGGTRNCDWLFTDEAIFLDTAGRYTTQDSNQAVDAAAWNGFLSLLKKNRPKQPINGVLVAMSISDLIQQTQEKNQQQAELIRQRITELSEKLGLRFPVYMVFTKSDLVAGFTELFDPLDSEKRAQVWGETFVKTEPDQLQGQIDRFMAGFEKSLHHINRWSVRRIHEERGLQRRSLIFDFPRQMALLRPNLKHFLQQAFTPNPYEKYAPMLRGVYLTSGTQEGTPIDRIMGLLASAYGLDRQQAPAYSGQGRSYFITRLLKDVVFPESHLAGLNPRMIRRRRLLQTASYGLAFLMAAGMVMLWSASYARSKHAIAQIQTQIEQYTQIRDDGLTRDAGIKALMARMDVIRAAQTYYERLNPWTGFGLDQKGKLKAGISMVYEPLLTQRFYPLVKGLLEQHIYANLDNSTDEQLSYLYDMLKTYLMLGNPRERLEPQFAELRIARLWEQNYSREPELWEHFNQHTQALLSLSVDPILLNEPLIEKARRTLNKRPIYEQIFMQMRTEAASVLKHDFFLVDALGPYGNSVFVTTNGQSLKSLRIPAIFTYEGYHDYFAGKGLNYVKQALTENWVLNNFAAAHDNDLYRLYDDLQTYYFRQYEKHWRGLLNTLAIRKTNTIDDKIKILDTFTGFDGPLRPLLRAVEKNTTLSRQTASADALSLPVPKPSVSSQALWLENKFQDFHHLIQSANGESPPIDGLLENLTVIRDDIMQISSSAASDDIALQKALERINGAGASERIKDAQMAFARQPEPLNEWFSSLTSSGLEVTLTNAKSELNALWRTEVLALYQKALQGRYPLYQDSTFDISLNDFKQFFMPNGIIDTFLQKHLDPFIDTTRTQWQPRKIDNQTLQLSTATLRQLQLAASIRQAFFAEGGASPLLHFELKPIDLDHNVAIFRIDIEGQKEEYSHGPILAKSFQWPGPNPGGGVRLYIKTLDGQTFSHSEEGDWAWFKVLEKAMVYNANQRDRLRLSFKVDGFTANYELKASSAQHPFHVTALQLFRCPESL